MGFQRQVERSIREDQENQKLKVYISVDPIGITGTNLYTLSDSSDEATHEIEITVAERNVLMKTESLWRTLQNFIKAKCDNFETKLATD